MSLPPISAASPQEDNPSPENARPEPYTIFSSCERRSIVGLLGTAMLISPLTATIHLPLLPLLSTHFRTSAEAINFTITVYIIFQVLAPLFLASVSDHCGRRPIYLATFALYTVASLGLPPPYSFNELQIGLAYLPGSIGVILSMYLIGKAMDRNYKHTAAKIGFMVNRVSGDNLANFPIE